MKADKTRYRSSKWAAREYGIDDEPARELVRVNVKVLENTREDKDENLDGVEQVKIISHNIDSLEIVDAYLATIKWWERALGFSVPTEVKDKCGMANEFRYKWNEYSHVPVEVQRLIVTWFLEGRSQVNIAYELSTLGITLYQVKHILSRRRVPTNRGFQPSVASLKMLLELWKRGDLPEITRELIEIYIDLGSYELVAEQTGRTVSGVKQYIKQAWDEKTILEHGKFDPKLVKSLNLGM